MKRDNLIVGGVILIEICEFFYYHGYKATMIEMLDGGDGGKATRKKEGDVKV